MSLALAPPASGLRVRVSAELQTFADVWPGIDDPNAPHVFQTRDFLQTWVETIGAARGVRPAFTRIDSADGQPLLLIPLGVEHRRGARVLTFLDGGVCDYNAPVLLSPEAASLPIDDLWRVLIAAVGPVDDVVLEKMPMKIGALANPLCALAVGPSAPSGHALSLDGDWRAYIATRLHRPKDSRRKRRRLAEAGAVKLVIARPGAEAERVYAALIAQKKRRYIEKNGVDGFDRPGYRAYFRRMTERFLGSGHAHLSALECDGELLATHWGLIHGKRFYCLMLAFAAAPLARYSPARLLVEDLIAWAYANGLERFDFGVGDGAWKKLLGAQPSPMAHARLPLTPYGWAYDTAAKLKRELFVPKRQERAHD
jgi:CelD/BcsL family acetyltransferase involved in cellulose biosynthesis